MQEQLTTRYHIYDLTHTLNSEVPTWDGTCDFSIHETVAYTDGYCQQAAAIGKLGVGTHIDSPCHFIPGGRSVDQLALSQLIAPAYIIDISDKAHADYQLSLMDIENAELAQGPISKGSLVIIATGWHRYWYDPLKYRNIDANGCMHFPTISLEAADYLLRKDIVGVGIDTLSPEVDEAFPVHHLLLGADKYILENLADCSGLPKVGAEIIALPPKIGQGTESILRVIALVPK